LVRHGFSGSKGIVRYASDSTEVRSPGGPLRKALTVLEALAAEPLTLSELADAVDLPKSTLHRLLGILVELNLATQTESKQYELGDYLPRLASHHAPARLYDVGCAITPFLLDLFQLTRQVVSVAMLTGDEVHHAGTLYDQDHARLALALRRPVPAHCSAAGKLLLATASRPPAESPAGFTPWTITRPERLDRELALIRRTGLSYARGEYLPELVEVAAPVRLGNPDPVAAVVVGGTVDRMDLRAIGRTLVDVVGSIEEFAKPGLG
jgi:IclR family transcriptional regulator, KDG regulon repressor